MSNTSLVIFQNMNLEERRAHLKKVANKIDFAASYNRDLSPQEINAEEGNYTRGSIQLKKLEAEAKASGESFKIKIKALEDTLEACLKKADTGKMDVQGDLYGIANFEDKRMCFYDIYGQMVYSRDLLPTEFQGNLLSDQTPNDKKTPLNVAKDVMKEAAAKAGVKGAEEPGGKATTGNEGEKGQEGAQKGQEDSKGDDKGKEPQTKIERPEGMEEGAWKEFEAQKQAEFAAKRESDGKAAKSTSKIDKKGLSSEAPKTDEGTAKTQALQKENAAKNREQSKLAEKKRNGR